MDLMTVSTFEKDSDDDWAQWNVAHVVTHYRLYNAMVAAGLTPLNYPIDMEDLRPDENWKQIHYQVHQALSRTLSIGSVPFDMSDVSFDNDEQFKDWHLLHALVHETLNQTLGLR
jgi:hypothetical protein